MAVKTLYLKDAAPAGATTAMSLLDGAASPATGITTTGWTVAKVTTPNYSSMTGRLKKASTGFVTSDQLGAVFDAKSCWRTEQPLVGSFANTNWTFVFPMRAVSAASAQTGQVRLRLWRSTNADGTGATQITSATQAGTTTAALSTSASSNSTVTYAPGAIITMTNQYLWVMCEWFVSVASGSNSGDAVFNIEAAAVITTPDFTQAYTGTGALVDTASTLAGTGTGRSTGTGALAAQSSAASGTGAAVDPSRAVISWLELSGAEAAAAGPVTGTGALASQASTLAAAGLSFGTGTGALVPQGSTIAASGTAMAPGTGVLAAESSTLAGTGTVGAALAPITGAGATVPAASIDIVGGIAGGSNFGDVAHPNVGQGFIATSNFVNRVRIGGMYVAASQIPTDGARIRIYTVDGNHAPVTAVGTASDVIPGGTFPVTAARAVDFIFSTPVPVVSGTEYIYVFERTDAPTPNGTYRYYFQVHNECYGGTALTVQEFNGSSWSVWIGGNYDIYSFIYQSAAVGLEARQSALAGTGTVVSAGVSTGTGALAAQASTLASSGISGSTGAGSGAASDLIIDDPANKAFQTFGGPGGYFEYVGQTFIAGGPSISKVKIALNRQGNPAGTIQVWLHTVNASHLPLTQIGASSIVAASTLPLSVASLIDFTFSPPVPVTPGVEYVFTSTRSVLSDTTDLVNLNLVFSDPYAGGQILHTASGIWETVGPYDLDCVISFVAAGGLQAAPSQLSGVDAGVPAATGTGALAAQSSTLAGTGLAIGAGTGALAAQSSTLSGTGLAIGAGTGALVAQPSAIAGTGASRSTGTGALVAQASTLAGTAKVTALGTGALVASTAALASTGTSRSTGTGALVAAPSSLVGAGAGVLPVVSGTGALAAAASQLAGTGQVAYAPSIGAGTLVIGASSLAGTGNVISPAITGTGVLQTQSAIFYGTGGVGNNYRLTAQPGSFTWSGRDATLRHGYVLQASPGQFNWYGNPVDLIHTEVRHLVLTAQPGVFRMTGNEVALNFLRLDKQPGVLRFGRPVILSRW